MITWQICTKFISWGQDGLSLLAHSGPTGENCIATKNLATVAKLLCWNHGFIRLQSILCV